MLKKIALVVCLLTGAAWGVAAHAAEIDVELAAGQCLVLAGGDAAAKAGPVCGCTMVHTSHTCVVNQTPEGWSCQGRCYNNGVLVGQCLWAFPTPAQLEIMAGVPSDARE